MSIINNTLLLGSGDEGYNLTRSLRFRSSASGYLIRTPATTTNRRTWTWSGWVKRGKIGVAQAIFGNQGPIGNNDDTLGFGFLSSDTFGVGSGFYYWLISSQVFRDPSAWYHLVVVLDTTQATANNRLKIYVNGLQITAFGTNDIATYCVQNFQAGVNTATAHDFGAYGGASPNSLYDGYMTEVNFIDGQALTPSSFGSTNALTGVWQPARYTGTYGTNGFYLPFTDNSALTTSSNVGLGRDYSGNGNYWTTNNISITAGVTYDSMTDVPTLTSATAANFCVWNPLDKDSSITASDGNLSASFLGSTEQHRIRGNISFPLSSKTYFEITVGSSVQGWVGIGNDTMPLNNTGATSYGINETGRYYVNGTFSTSPFSGFTTGNVIGIAVDTTANTITFYKNGVAETPGAQSITSGLTYFPVAAIYNAIFVINFGQRPFTYTPPTGFVALNTFNLPTSTIVKGNTVMDATIYSGDNASPRSITNAAGFKPDLVWVKSRSNLQSHKFTDSVRGAVNAFYTDSTSANDATPLFGSISAFNSNGFALSSGGSGISDVNGSGQNYVAWQWQAGQGTTSSNTSGTITSTVSVNASAGFSIVSFTGNATQNATVGHGLGVAPTVVIYKNKDSARTWSVISESLLGLDGYVYLNTTAIKGTGASELRASTSSVLTLPGTYPDINPSGEAMLAYCWTPIAGYSAFGTFTGNGSADGNFLYLGFLPKFLIVKNLTGVESWLLWDTARGTYNVVSPVLNPNSNAIEGTNAAFDFVSNGVKLRNSTVQTYIYWAFASNPFKNSLAR